MNKFGLNFFDCVLYINLSHRVDRKELLEKELNRLGVIPEKIIRIEPNYEPFNGHRGCASGHIKALSYAIEQNVNNALILEDDFVSSREPSDVHRVISYFHETIGHAWDVFFLGGNIEKYEKSSQPGVYRALSARCAHAYSVNSHYLAILKGLFEYAHHEMKNDIVFFDSYGKAIDRLWDCLMQRDRWHFVEIIAQQRDSYSDIELGRRDRIHRETFN